MEPDVSVIIPAMNAAGTLPDCLLALRAQTMPRERFEVIVVDDGSTDSTAAVAEKYRTRVIRLRNSGPAVARNRGVEAAKGNILVFTDADCAPEPSFLEANWRKVQAVMTEPGRLDRMTKEIIAVAVSAVMGCRY